ncbi:hypothetical protein [Actinoplanes sp. N902-109]|uniref:hypothetical protein n=1 Tax=Actinoplanes sp. (strain N902-109) TaxID=649831 RepID=UPI0003294BB1|nr:hypothetical protein [Actinoplanes sp. N902-109]AGL19504.1 hypothetical protein L083_5994 [Actinoplanes sp. N902-109]
MADNNASKSTASGATGNTAVPAHGDHDRVAMLSLRPDGTPDQHNPELIGDRDAALAATKRQYAEQAVSAVDAQQRGVDVAEQGETAEQDPTIAELTKAHEAAASDAAKAAEATVKALTTDDSKSTTSK